MEFFILWVNVSRIFHCMQDQELIQSIQSGHTDGFALLVKKYTDKVFRIAMGFMHQQEEAEDITQEVFVKAWQSLDRFNYKSAFSTWLFRIAINESINALNRKKRKKAWSRLSSLFQAETSVADTAKPAEEKEEFRQVRQWLETLTRNQQTAFVLYEYEELSQHDIAVIMDISEGAVEQLLLRARQQLRKKMEKFRRHP